MVQEQMLFGAVYAQMLLYLVNAQMLFCSAHAQMLFFQRDPDPNPDPLVRGMDPRMIRRRCLEQCMRKCRSVVLCYACVEALLCSACAYAVLCYVYADAVFSAHS